MIRYTTYGLIILRKYAFQQFEEFPLLGKEDCCRCVVFFFCFVFFAVKCSPQRSPQFHHFRTVLPSNGETSSRHALYNRDAADRTRGGVGGGRSVDIFAASNNQHRDFTADMIAYRSHSVHSRDIKMLSEQTAAACTVQEIRGKTMSSQRPSSSGADQENINLRSVQITWKHVDIKDRN